MSTTSPINIPVNKRYRDDDAIRRAPFQNLKLVGRHFSKTQAGVKSDRFDSASHHSFWNAQRIKSVKPNDGKPTARDQCPRTSVRDN